MSNEHCPFCGGKIEIGICDSEGNLHGPDYEKAPWSGLEYVLLHDLSMVAGCPIASHDGEILGAYIYSSREAAEDARSRRAPIEEEERA